MRLIWQLHRRLFRPPGWRSSWWRPRLATRRPAPVRSGSLSDDEPSGGGLRGPPQPPRGGYQRRAAAGVATDGQAQQQTDSELAASESPASIAQAERETMPVPAVSGSYPAIPGSDEADATATRLAFCRELLDIRLPPSNPGRAAGVGPVRGSPRHPPGCARPDRRQIPGRQPGLQRCTSGAEPTPVPAAGEWSQPATGRRSSRCRPWPRRWRPTGRELVATGWEPVDPLMTIITVTGTITTSTPGQPASLGRSRWP